MYPWGENERFAERGPKGLVRRGTFPTLPAVPAWLVHYFAITLKFVRPISSAPREAVTITFQVPAIESWPLPR